MKHLLATLLLCTSLGLTATTFHPGGTTWNFEAISKARFDRPNTAENLIEDATKWTQGTAWMHTPDTVLANQIRPKLIPHIKQTAQISDSQAVLRTEKPINMEALAGQHAANLSASWIRTITFNPQEAMSYDFGFHYTYAKPGKYPAAGFVLLEYHHTDGKTHLDVKSFPLGNGQKQQFICSFDKPREVDSILVYLRLDGCGTIEFINPYLNRKQVNYPAQVLFVPGALLDNTFALSQHDPAILTFAWKRLVPKDKWNVQDPQLHVILPPEVTVRECMYPLVLQSQNGREFIFSLKNVKNRHRIIDGWDSHLLLPLMLTTDAQPGTKLAQASYWLTDGIAMLSERLDMSFSVIPHIDQAAKSSKFLNGFQPMGAYLGLKKPENQEFWAKFIGDTGMRWLASGASAEMRKLYRKHGILMITPELYWLANGYRIGEPNHKPDYAKYRSLPNAHFSELSRATCPTAIYKRTPFFQNKVIPYLQRELKGTDGAISNWEPFMFHGMGCFCDNCRAEFAAYAKLPLDQVKKAWPQELTINRKYHQLGIRFRSWQHAKMVKVLNEEIRKASSGKAGFVPEIAWLQMTDSHKRLDHCDEFDPLDYAGHLTYIDPWGPYICWPPLRPYTYEKAPNLHTYAAAQKVVEFTRKNFPATKRPKLLALPHGVQSNFWVTQPEALAMEVLGFFVAGYDASTSYLFPKGYDNRFWAFQAQANDTIANHEDMVCDGTPINTVSVTPLTPYPAPKKRLNKSYFHNLNADLLQVAAFQKDGKVLAAVGNFWTKGDVFFNLKIADLPTTTKYVVLDQDLHRLYLPPQRLSFTAAQLAQGIRLHVGALRWTFLDIIPEKDLTSLDKMDLVRPETVLDAQKTRLSFLQKAAEKEALLDAAEERQYRRSDLKPMKLGTLDCQPGNDASGAQVVTMTSGKNSLRLGLNSMAIQSWTVNGTEIIKGTSSSGLGAPAFWMPSCQVNGTFFVTKQEKLPNGNLLITAERTVTKKEHASLNHLIIRQSFEFSPALDALILSTDLVNGNDSETGMASITAGYRFHILPSFLGLRGRIDFSKNNQTVSYRRMNRNLIFATKANQTTEALAKLFVIPGEPQPIDGTKAIWRSADGHLTVHSTISPADRFAGYAVWDTPDMATSTLEPYFDAVTIPAGQKASYRLELKVKP